MENIRQAILDADIWLFRLINTGLHNDIAAEVIKFVGNDIVVAAVIFGGLFYMAKQPGKNIKVNIAFSLWALIAANLLSTYVLKPFFGRLRPPAALPDVNLLVEMRKFGWAFPSTHTAMAAALVTVLWNEYKNLRPVMALFVLFMGFFCVYTGGHYPLDVLGGLILGIIIGTVINILKKYVVKSHKS